MESYQPWPIFNVQNELAEVQKRELQFKSGEWYMYFFLSEILLAVSRPLLNQPPLTAIILQWIYFSSGEGQEPQGLKEGNRRCSKQEEEVELLRFIVVLAVGELIELMT